MVLSINCRHREVRSRVVTRDGKLTRREEFIWITDVRQNIEISSCIFPWGRISTDAGGPVEEVLDKYLRDTSPLKSLSLDKKVLGLDQERLCQLVRDHYKNNGYGGECNVTIEFGDNLVRVAAPSDMAACIDSCWCQCLMCITIIPMCIYCAYAGNHQSDGLQAVFQVPPVYTPQTVFSNIVNQLHHPGFARNQGFTDLHRARMDRRYFEQQVGARR